MTTLDLTGGKLDLKCTAGDDVAFVLSTGSDLSAYTWTGQIRLTADAVDPALGSYTFDTLTTTSGIARISDAVTRALGPGRYVYDIQVQAPGGAAGAITTIMSGKFTVVEDVTR